MIEAFGTRMVKLNDFVIGETLSNDICNHKGIKLISKGAIITESMVTKLSKYGITEVFIYDKQSKYE